MAFGSPKSASEVKSADLQEEFEALLDQFYADVDDHEARAADRHSTVKNRLAALEAEDVALQQHRDRIASVKGV